jgi:hypothetical protein
MVFRHLRDVGAGKCFGPWCGCGGILSGSWGFGCSCSDWHISGRPCYNVFEWCDASSSPESIVAILFLDSVLGFTPFMT